MAKQATHVRVVRQWCCRWRAPAVSVTRQEAEMKLAASARRGPTASPMPPSTPRASKPSPRALSKAFRPMASLPGSPNGGASIGRRRSRFRRRRRSARAASRHRR